MAFAEDYITAGILIRIDLPDKIIRVTDGGVAIFSGEGDGVSYVYRSEDPDYGTITGAEPLSEGEGDEVPAANLTFLPPGNAASEALTSPDMQFSPVSIWLIEKDDRTGLVTYYEGYFFGAVDLPTFREGSEGRLIDMRLVSLSEFFFQSNDGNRLSAENHTRIHNGERGLDNMTGVEIEVPWGSQTTPRAGSTTRPSTGSLVQSLFD